MGFGILNVLSPHPPPSNASFKERVDGVGATEHLSMGYQYRTEARMEKSTASRDPSGALPAPVPTARCRSGRSIPTQMLLSRKAVKSLRQRRHDPCIMTSQCWAPTSDTTAEREKRCSRDTFTASKISEKGFVKRFVRIGRRKKWSLSNKKHTFKRYGYL